MNETKKQAMNTTTTTTTTTTTKHCDSKKENNHNNNVLYEKFESICFQNGDDDAIYYHDTNYTKNTDTNTNTNDIRKSIGFTELQQSIHCVGSELVHRHGLTCGSIVWIVSSLPSVGEVVALLTCTKLGMPFVPISSNSDSTTTSTTRWKQMMKDTKPSIAIVIVPPKPYNSDTHDDDDDNYMTTNNTNDDSYYEELLIVQTLINDVGLHRMILISSQDGMPTSPLTALMDLSLPTVATNHSSLLYIMYTSGSTSTNGRPKAVMQTCQGLWNRLQWQWNVFPFTDKKEIIIRRTALSFVDSMAEIYGTLLQGHSLYCCSSPTPTTALLELAQSIHATRMTLLPFQLQHLLQQCSSSNNNNSGWIWKCATMIIISGESCPSTLPTMFETIVGNSTSTLLVNLYGQTETSGDVTCSILVPRQINRIKQQSLSSCSNDISYYIWKQPPTTSTTLQQEEELQYYNYTKWMVPVGKAIMGHHFLILNKNRNKNKNYPMGRLYVSGPGVALGYKKYRSETNAKFIPYSQLLQQNKDVCCFSSTTHEDDIIYFDTGDLAFYDSIHTQQYYILGRASDGTTTDDKESIMISTKMGKVNGVMIHCLEMELLFENAFSYILQQTFLHNTTNNNNNTNTSNYHSMIHVAATILPPSSVHLTKTTTATSRTVLFLDLTTFSRNPKFQIEILRPPPKQKEDDHSSIICYAPGTIKLSYHNDGTTTPATMAKTMDELFVQTRRMLLYHPTYKCPSSLHPHVLFVLNRFPTNGAAGKIHHRSLHQIALSNIQTIKEEDERKDNDKTPSILSILRKGTLYNLFKSIIFFVLFFDETN